MREPPGLPVASHGLPSLKTSVGVMEESGRLPGETAFASPLNQAITIRRARFSGEVIHLIIQQHTSARDDNPRAITEVDGVGIGDHIAVLIGYRVMRGFRAFGNCHDARLDRFRWRCDVGLDQLTPFIEVVVSRSAAMGITVRSGSPKYLLIGIG